MIVVYSCGPQETPMVPTVITGEVTNVTTTTASCEGNVSADGGFAITERGVCWSTSENPTISDSKTTDDIAQKTKAEDVTGLGTYTSNITGLSPNTTYYVRAYATNSQGTGYGEQRTFTTNAQQGMPTVTTGNVTNIGTTTATCGGNVTGDGGAAVTARGVCWSTTQNPTTTNSKTSNGTGVGAYSSNLTGLSPNTTYYVKAYATNSKGTAYGEQKTFTTLAAIASLTTTAVTNITSYGADTGGNITNNGGSDITSRGVCWSTAANPTADLATHTQDGSGSGVFTSTLTGLASRTTYYIRAYAINAAGTAYGQQITLTTPASISLSKTSLTIAAEGGTNNSVTVTAYLAWTAEVTSSSGWLTLNTTSGDVASSQLSFDVQPNTTSQDRSATIRITCQDMHLDIAITQLRAGGYIDDGNLL